MPACPACWIARRPARRTPGGSRAGPPVDRPLPARRRPIWPRPAAGRFRIWSRRGCGSCSPGSTRACTRRPPATTSRGRATGSGLPCTSLASPAASYGLRSSRCCSALASASRTSWPGPLRGQTNWTPTSCRRAGRRWPRWPDRSACPWLAILGVTAYRTAFGQRQAVVGPQSGRLGGARVWILPNPSGLNAHWSAAALAAEFGRLRCGGCG